MIYLIKQEGLYQNKVTVGPASIHNCKMAYWPKPPLRASICVVWKFVVLTEGDMALCSGAFRKPKMSGEKSRLIENATLKSTGAVEK